MVLSTGLGLMFAFGSTGCGSGSSGTAPAAINPEAEKKKDEMLQNYGKQAAERARAERQKKRP